MERSARPCKVRPRQATAPASRLASPPGTLRPSQRQRGSRGEVVSRGTLEFGQSVHFRVIKERQGPKATPNGTLGAPLSSAQLQLPAGPVRPGSRSLVRPRNPSWPGQASPQCSLREDPTPKTHSFSRARILALLVRKNI